jgi:hypothetical protein
MLLSGRPPAHLRSIMQPPRTAVAAFGTGLSPGVAVALCDKPVHMTPQG